jgi:hypothetical protein
LEELQLFVLGSILHNQKLHIHKHTAFKGGCSHAEEERLPLRAELFCTAVTKQNGQLLQAQTGRLTETPGSTKQEGSVETLEWRLVGLGTGG